MLTEKQLKLRIKLNKALKADSAGIPVFLKNNLYELLPEEEPFWKFRQISTNGAEGFLYRQEFPKEAN